MTDSITKNCSIEDCKRPYIAKLYCGLHYRRWKKHGDPLKTAFEWHGKTRSPEFRAWSNMKNRCYNPNYFLFHHYGGRGIKVCDRWLHSFKNFYEDMGDKPSPMLSLERINNNKNYEPSNCKWATKTEQSNNRSMAKLFTLKGETKTLKQWSDYYNQKYKTVHARISYGRWTIEEALGIIPRKHI